MAGLVEQSAIGGVVLMATEQLYKNAVTVMILMQCLRLHRIGMCMFMRMAMSMNHCMQQAHGLVYAQQ